MDWRAELDWSKRPPEFGPLIVRNEIPAMEFRPRNVTDGWLALCDTWRDLRLHPSVLEALTSRGDGTVVLRYVPIVWSARRAPDNIILRWAAQIDAAMSMIESRLPQHDRWLFSRPDVHVDVGSGIRLGFLPPSGSARDVILTNVASELIAELSREMSNARLAEAVRRRYAKIVEPMRARVVTLDEAVEIAEPFRTGMAKAAWEKLERAIGFWQLGDEKEALEAFEDADFILSTELTRWGVNECRRVLGIPLLDAPPPQKERVVIKPARAAPHRSWADAEPQVARLEAERDFKSALRLYETLGRTAEEQPLVLARRARCHLELHETGHAIDYAQRSLALDPTRTLAHATLVRAWLEHREPARALAAADALVRVATHDAMAHYLRGKALLVLARIDEALEEFDLAITFKPTMLEAIMLRIQADRTLRQLGKVVGTQRVTLTLPEHLEPLREVVASGRSKNIIEALSAPSLGDDVEAQLMLARFLAFADRHDDAIAIYDRWIDSPHRGTALVGKAGALLDTGRIESALSLFDVAVTEQPSNLDACEGRARVLDTLGRTSEAAAEFRRFISLGAQRAELRVRAAQLWLDAH